jgi:hypothetical protein
MIRERMSRAISLVLTGRNAMLCAIAEEHEWPARHVLNGMFLDRNHCRAAAEWEALWQRREITVVDRARQSGGL